MTYRIWIGESKMIKLGIIFGGRSGEHEISLLSAASVIRAVDKSKYEVITIGITKKGKWLLFNGSIDDIEDGSWESEAEKALAAEPERYTLTLMGTDAGSLRSRIDFALPVLHGPFGEDGTIQGLFEMIDIPYAGSGVTGSALAMDKILAKTVFAQAGLPQGAYTCTTAEELEKDETTVISKIENALAYPVFVKPANMGSSVGITKAKDRETLSEALTIAASIDRRILIEQGIDCRELETGILGNFYAEASGVGEIIPSAEFYNYLAKYFDGGQSKICIPADITQKAADEIRAVALKAYRLLDCAGFARADFFMEKMTGKIYINEINTIPGFTRFSMFSSLWAHEGIPYPELIERIVTLGYERYHAKNHRQAAL